MTQCAWSSNLRFRSRFPLLKYSDHNNEHMCIRKICFSPKNGDVSVSKYSPIIETNLVPLIRANTVPADLDPRTEMSPIAGWNSNVLFMGLFWLKW